MLIYATCLFMPSVMRNMHEFCHVRNETESSSYSTASCTTWTSPVNLSRRKWRLVLTLDNIVTSVYLDFSVMAAMGKVGKSRGRSPLTESSGLIGFGKPSPAAESFS